MLDATTLDSLFREARSHHHWKNEPVSDKLLEAVYDLAKWGPTSVNCSPLRIIFVKSPEGKEKLKACLAEGNIQQTTEAPVTAIIGQDMAFYEKLPTLFPYADARSWFVGNEALTESTAFRNTSLQAAYFIIAARALGLDCGPMSGFNNAAVDEAFFKGTSIRSNFLCNLGHGDPAQLHPRGPRLSFSETCQFA